MANGKRGSAQNAITHGVFAKILLSGPGSAEGNEFEKLLSDAKDAVRPRNGLEEALVEKLVIQFVRLRRVYKADLKIAPKLFARVRDNLKEIEPALLSLGTGVAKAERFPTIESVVRYETTIERQIGRTLSQIQQLREMTEIEVEPISQDAEASEPQSSIPSQDLEAHS